MNARQEADLNRRISETVRKGREQRAALEYGPRPAVMWNTSTVNDLLTPEAAEQRAAQRRLQSYGK